MIHFLHFLLCTLIISSSGLATTITKLSDKLLLQVQAPTNPGLIINGLNNRDFVRLNSAPSDIRILCSKQAGITAGRISAFVNTQQAEFVRCLEYASGYANDDVYCLRHEFRFSLPTKGYSYYEIMCRYVETQDLSRASLFLHRLCKFLI